MNIGAHIVSTLIQIQGNFHSVVLSQDSRHHLDMCHAYTLLLIHHQYQLCQVLYSVHSAVSQSTLHLLEDLNILFVVSAPTAGSLLQFLWTTDNLRNRQFAVFDWSMFDNRHLLVTAARPGANKVKWTMTRLREERDTRHRSCQISKESVVGSILSRKGSRFLLLSSFHLTVCQTVWGVGMIRWSHDQLSRLQAGSDLELQLWSTLALAL